MRNRVQELENALHEIKGLLERYVVPPDADTFEHTLWIYLHRKVSRILEQSTGETDPLREEARRYLREFLNFPIDRFQGDDPRIRMYTFASEHPDWKVIAPQLGATEPNYTVRHVTGAEYVFNYFEIEGSAST